MGTSTGAAPHHPDSSTTVVPPSPSPQLGLKDAKAARKAEKEALAAAKKRQREEAKAERESRKAAKSAEASARRAAKAAATKAAGKQALQEITVVVDPSLVAGTWAGGLMLLAKLKDKASIAPFAIEVAPLPLAHLNCVAWKRKSGGQGAHDAVPLDAGETGQGETSTWLPYVALLMRAPEFVAALQRDRLMSVLREVYGTFNGERAVSLGVVVCGLEAHLRSEERQNYKTYLDARATGLAEGGPVYSKQALEGALVELQVSHPALRLYSAQDEDDMACHLNTLTSVLARQPYTSRDGFLSAFKSGKAGAAASQTSKQIMIACEGLPAAKRAWIEALSRLDGVSAAHAVAIAERYRSLGALLQAYEDCGESAAKRMKLVEGLAVPQWVLEAVTLGSSLRKVGPTVSKRLHRILTTTQPGELVKE